MNSLFKIGGIVCLSVALLVSWPSTGFAKLQATTNRDILSVKKLLGGKRSSSWVSSFGMNVSPRIGDIVKFKKLKLRLVDADKISAYLQTVGSGRKTKLVFHFDDLTGEGSTLEYNGAIITYVGELLRKQNAKVPPAKKVRYGFIFKRTDQESTSLPPPKCETADIACTAQWEPVCALFPDGSYRTAGNACEALAQCAVRIVYEQPCPEVFPN